MKPDLTKEQKYTALLSGHIYFCRGLLAIKDYSTLEEILDGAIKDIEKHEKDKN
jgi:hypothetical protein